MNTTVKRGDAVSWTDGYGRTRFGEVVGFPVGGYAKVRWSVDGWSDYQVIDQARLRLEGTAK